jgi:hypothetical protein
MTVDGGIHAVHSKFGTVRPLDANCGFCHWGYTGSLAATTAAARQHVLANPAHRVYTTRKQVKVTFARKWDGATLRWGDVLP